MSDEIEKKREELQNEDAIPQDEKVLVRELMVLDDWHISEARKEKEDEPGKYSVRWIARRARQLIDQKMNAPLMQSVIKDGKNITVQLVQFTEVLVADDQEHVSVYAYRGRLETQERTSGLLNPDPVPITIIATLLGIRSFNQDHSILTPDDPRFIEMANQLKEHHARMKEENNGKAN